MILTIRSVEDLSFMKLTELYKDNIESNRIKHYSKMGEIGGRFQAENDLYYYIKDVFFKQSNGTYLIYQCEDKYVSGLRFERYEDGVLLNALMTSKEYRRKGFASLLLHHLIQNVQDPIYSHIHCDNTASILLHKRFGFELLCDHSFLLDGSFSDEHFTYIRRT